MPIDTLDAILLQSCDNLRALFSEHREDLIRLVSETPDDSPVTINHSIRLDFGKNKQTDRLSFSLRGGDCVECPIPNPNQIMMPFDDNV